MADKKETPRRPVSEAARDAGDNSPFSIPLEKGGDILAESAALKETVSSKSPEEAKRGGTAQESIPADKGKPVPASCCHGVRMWKLLLAMFLFPFFFNLGSELYLLARTAAMAQMGGLQAAPEPATKPSGKSDFDKVIDSLALVIANQEKLLRDTGQRVVIIHPEYTGTFSYDDEKGKVKELAGIDLDDPVTGSDKIGKIKSAELLSAIIRSFDRILLNAAQNNLSEFRVKNTLEAKKQALKRLQELR